MIIYPVIWWESHGFYHGDVSAIGCHAAMDFKEIFSLIYPPVSSSSRETPEHFPAMDLVSGGHCLVIRQGFPVTLQSMNIDSDDSQCEWDLILENPYLWKGLYSFGGTVMFFYESLGIHGIWSHGSSLWVSSPQQLEIPPTYPTGPTGVNWSANWDEPWNVLPSHGPFLWTFHIAMENHPDF